MKKSIMRDLTTMCSIFFLIPIILILIISQISELWKFLLCLTIPYLFLSILLIRYIRKNIINPIRYLVNEANIISSGVLSHSLTPFRTDELGHLISAFNQMRATLEKHQLSQKQFEEHRKNFIDSISHDLKTPLASISVYIEALQDGMFSSPEEQQQYLNIIKNKMITLTKLSNQLNLSCETVDTVALSLQKIHCYHWTADLFMDLELECRTKGITPSLSNKISATDPFYFQIDILQLDRAIQNITSNAFRHYKHHFSVSAEIKNACFILHLENDGASEELPHPSMLFERFFTGEPMKETGHLGLGLYITKTLIEAMNGNIQAFRNTTILHFKITFPLC